MLNFLKAGKLRVVSFSLFESLVLGKSSWGWGMGVRKTYRTERSGEKFSLIIAATSSSEGF